MSDFENKIVHTENWEEMSFSYLRSKEVSPAAKGALHVWLKMDPIQAAREAHVLSALMEARLLSKKENQ